jgi:CrcB protein
MVLGFLAATYLHHADPTHKNWYLLLGTGFCGGFTTFSTFSYETLQLILDHRPWRASLYVFGSVSAGLFGAWLGVRMAGN